MPVKDLFTRFAECTDDGICRCTLDEGRVLYANRAFVRILDLCRAPGALTGRRLRDLVPGVRGLWELPRRSAGARRVECRFSTRAGKGRRIVRCSFSAADPATGVQTAVLIVRDVTARTREEERLRSGDARRLRLERLVTARTSALRDSESQFRTLIQQIPAITYVAALDAASTTLFVSPQIRRIGYSVEECRRDRDFWRKRLHPDDRARVLREVTRQRLTDRPFATEYRMIARDGSTVWFRDEARLVRRKGGAPFFLQGVMFDITERKRMDEELEHHREHLADMVRTQTLELTEANERLRESEAKYRELVEHANSIILKMDRRGRVTFFNEFAERFFGFRQAEILGRSIVGTIVPEVESSGRNLREQIRRIARNPDAYMTNANENITRDGRRVWVAWTNRGITDSRGALVGVLAIGNDVTEHKRAEDRTARLNRLKERLLGSMGLADKLRLITDGVVEMLEADFARIWMTAPGDLCGTGCIHAAVRRGPHVCRTRSHCLHLMASSGRYSRIDRSHRRVPMGCYKIGRVATGRDPGFVTNDVVHDPRVHDHAWARSLGLASFAGYRLLSDTGRPMGVFAFFSAHPITPEDLAMLEDVAHTISQVIKAGRAEEARTSSESQHRNTLDLLAEAIHVVDPALRIVLANKVFTRWARRLGVRGGMVGRAVRDVFPFLPRAVEREYTRVFRTGRMLITEERIMLGGREVITETRKIPVLEGGRTIRVITAISNITARRRAERAIRESEEKYRSLMAGAGDAIFLAHSSGKLIETNRRGQELLGYSKRELVGMHVARLHPPEARARAVGEFRAMAEGSMREAHDVPLLTKGGKIIPVDITASPVRCGGTTLIQGIMRDITEWKKVQAMKDTLIRDVSHELKAPIAMMEMAHGMAREALAAQDFDGMRKAEEIAARNLAILARDIGNIVGMCALSGRTMVPKPVPFSLKELAREIAEEMRDRIGNRRIALRVRIAPNADRIVADRRMMRTLLFNIVDNAVKFTRSGTVAVSARRAGGWLTLRVMDTGQGILPEAAAFEKFYKKDSAMQGTGLGLPICREIADLYGGTIRLVSRRRGKGTTAVVRLPARSLAARRAGGRSQ